MPFEQFAEQRSVVFFKGMLQLFDGELLWHGRILDPAGREHKYRPCRPAALRWSGPSAGARTARPREMKARNAARVVGHEVLAFAFLIARTGCPRSGGRQDFTKTG